MSTPAISVHNLGKRYSLGSRVKTDSTFRETVVDVLASPFRNLRKIRQLTKADDRNPDTIWAIRDISFDVHEGEVIGIIGRNGAGKSTLLKILSRITEPSSGEVLLHGRVASLLEVGTGFHPELTGRENIYLNGAILGMRKSEIERKFDEIVAFSEIEKFIDTPVKRYSSGMYVRLAFAVAAHLEPEILLVDEVLAVGDAAFQKKCLGKMSEVGRQGRTILFVSHNMQAIKQLCDSALVLENGSVSYRGEVEQSINTYLGTLSSPSGQMDISQILQSLPPDPAIEIRNVRILQEGYETRMVQNGKPMEILLDYSILQPTKGLRVYFDLCDQAGTLIFRSFHDEDSDGIPTVQPGLYCSTATIPKDLLGPRAYKIIIRAGIYNARSCLSPEGITIDLSVEHTGSYNRAYMSDTFRGQLAPRIPWVTVKQ